MHRFGRLGNSLTSVKRMIEDYITMLYVIGNSAESIVYSAATHCCKTGDHRFITSSDQKDQSDYYRCIGQILRIQDSVQDKDDAHTSKRRITTTQPLCCICHFSSRRIVQSVAPITAIIITNRRIFTTVVSTGSGWRSVAAVWSTFWGRNGLYSC
jgi:hypothetical protein